MKPFNLERAKAGDPVCTENGEIIKLIYFDMPGYYPIAGFQDCYLLSFRLDGVYWDYRTNKTCELFMAPKKIQYWVNVYRNPLNKGIWTGGSYQTEELAKNESYRNHQNQYIKTILIYEEEI